jgi:hypothetical protein
MSAFWRAISLSLLCHALAGSVILWNQGILTGMIPSPRPWISVDAIQSGSAPSGDRTTHSSQSQTADPRDQSPAPSEQIESSGAAESVVSNTSSDTDLGRIAHSYSESDPGLIALQSELAQTLRSIAISAKTPEQVLTLTVSSSRPYLSVAPTALESEDSSGESKLRRAILEFVPKSKSARQWILSHPGQKLELPIRILTEDSP